MPKISKLDFYDTRAKKRPQLYIEYSSKLGGFFVKVPSYITDAVSVDVLMQFDNVRHYYSRRNYTIIVKGDTEEAVEYNYKKFIKDYYDTQAKTEDIIGYKLSYSATMNYENFYAEGAELNSNKEKRSYDRTDNAKISLDWFIGKYRVTGDIHEYIMNKDDKYIRDYNSNKMLLNQYSTAEWKHIPYTKAAEKFFRELDSGLKTLITKVDKYLGDTDMIHKAIKGNLKLLSGK